jgi:hypothetical protein
VGDLCPLPLLLDVSCNKRVPNLRLPLIPSKLISIRLRPVLLLLKDGERSRLRERQLSWLKARLVPVASEQVKTAGVQFRNNPAGYVGIKSRPVHYRAVRIARDS